MWKMICQMSGKQSEVRGKNESGEWPVLSLTAPFLIFVPHNGTISNQLMTILRRICELSGLLGEKEK